MLIIYTSHIFLIENCYKYDETISVAILCICNDFDVKITSYLSIAYSCDDDVTKVKRLLHVEQP